MNKEMKTVLLVEDREFLSDILKSRLLKAGVNILHATDGETAMNMLSENKVDLVLLDIILPKKSGFEVLEDIQSDSRLSEVKVIVASNLGQDADKIRGKELGAIDYYVKAQTSIDEIIAKVRTALDLA